MIIDDFALPSGDEADRLLQGLGRLIQLLRRLLAYAGLEPKRLDIEIYGDATRDPHVKLDEQGESAAAWFMDIAEGVYRFGVRETERSQHRRAFRCRGTLPRAAA